MPEFVVWGDFSRTHMDSSFIRRLLGLLGVPACFAVFAFLLLFGVPESLFPWGDILFPVFITVGLSSLFVLLWDLFLLWLLAGENIGLIAYFLFACRECNISYHTSHSLIDLEWSRREWLAYCWFTIQHSTPILKSRQSESSAGNTLKATCSFIRSSKIHPGREPHTRTPHRSAKSPQQIPSN